MCRPLRGRCALTRYGTGEPELTRACALRDIPLNGARQVVIGGVPIALVRTSDGVFAVHDRCPHADATLSDGEVDGITIECWLHGSQFDLRTGEALTTPARTPVPVFPVEVASVRGDETVFVDPSPRRFLPKPGGQTVPGD